jgi:2-C-methyl-D-erythritol 4-phosphate cytidylyltransferase
MKYNKNVKTMNIAMIIAGGIGSRMNADIPKQFIEINDKPILVYTLEAFQRHPEIDAILVVVIQDWEDVVKSYIEDYKLTKLKWVVQGGQSGQESARLGLKALKNHIQPTDYVVIHDAIRPIVPGIILTDLLRVARLHGNACASLPMHETIVITQNQLHGNKNLDRNEVRRVQTPQAYRYQDVLEAHLWAEKENRPSVYANTLMIDFGQTIYFSLGFDNNIKITTSEDLALFKALLMIPEEDLVRT